MGTQKSRNYDLEYILIHVAFARVVNHTLLDTEMFEIPKKLMATEGLVMVIFLVFLIWGCIYTFGSYKHDKDKKQAGIIMLGSAGIIASLSVMPLILNHLAEQSEHMMSTESLVEGLRDLLRIKSK